MPPLTRVRDTCIMNSCITISTQFTTLQRTNQCWLYLQFITTTNISNIHGTHIEQWHTMVNSTTLLVSYSHDTPHLPHPIGYSGNVIYHEPSRNLTPRSYDIFLALVSALTTANFTLPSPPSILPLHPPPNIYPPFFLLSHPNDYKSSALNKYVETTVRKSRKQSIMVLY